MRLKIRIQTTHDGKKHNRKLWIERRRDRKDDGLWDRNTTRGGEWEPLKAKRKG